jgi:hypothetical protein
VSSNPSIFNPEEEPHIEVLLTVGRLVKVVASSFASGIELNANILSKSQIIFIHIYRERERERVSRKTS